MASSQRLSTIAVATAFVLLSLVLASHGQENVQTRIPNWLTECYRNASMADRDNRLPSNINILIELIRKFENWPSHNMDMREVASTLVHRFRMDGIERAAGQFVANVLPFSPSGFQFSKHRVLLARLVPGSGAQFPEASLSGPERCALHFMLSTSIERQARNDEARTCNQLAQVRSMRIPRSVPQKNNFLGDVELLQEVHVHRRGQHHPQVGRYVEGGDDDDGIEMTAADGAEEGELLEPANGIDEANNGGDQPAESTIDSPGGELADDVDFLNGAGTTLSQCPAENGVIRTAWGAVSGGPLITGIAAGLQPQAVPTRDLLALSRAASQFHHSARQSASDATRVDNRWAATLAGDLAEVTLLQGPITQSIQVGGIGGWNSTSVPRWYFLSQRDRLEMTDAEIRGGLDGLILASNLNEWRQQAQQLRVSQLLDMYYSQRGVFGSTAASCNRRALFTQVAPLATIRAQTEAFVTVLDREMQMRVTLRLDTMRDFANSAAQALSTYIPQSLNDPSCATTSIVPGDSNIWRSAADLHIFIDTRLTFRESQPVVASLLDSIDVNPFGSNFTLLNARDGSVIVPSTNSLSDFYLGWTQIDHERLPTALSLPDVVRALRNITAVAAETEQRDSSNARGAQLALIVVPGSATVSDADNEFALQELGLLRNERPDMTLLFLAGGVPTRFSRYVRDASRDLFTLQTLGTNAENVAVQTIPVTQRIQTANRRIINPRCGVNWQQAETGSHTQNQYVERGSLNFYRLLPNYFFYASGDDNRRVRFQGHGYAPITVCTSRTIAMPQQNISNADNDITCRTLLTDSMEVELRDFCSGHSVIHQCPPLFVSVAGAAAADSGPGTSAAFRCIDRECRFPDNIRFSITTDNLGCWSAAGRVVTSLRLVGVLVAVWLIISMRST